MSDVKQHPPILTVIEILNELKKEIISLRQDMEYVKSKFLAIDEFINIEEPKSPKAKYYSFW